MNLPDDIIIYIKAFNRKIHPTAFIMKNYINRYFNSYTYIKYEDNTIFHRYYFLTNYLEATKKCGGLPNISF